VPANAAYTFKGLTSGVTVTGAGTGATPTVKAGYAPIDVSPSDKKQIVITLTCTVS